MNTPNKGSEWRKWDLHVHSPASYGFSGSWDQFEQQLKSADCSVIGINDYCSVDGYKKIKEKIESGTLDIGRKTILPVVEFRMRDVLKNKHITQSGTNINFHVIFDNSIPVSKIETFIKSLVIDGAQIADKYSDKQFLRETAKVYFEKDIIDALKNNPDFTEKFIVLLPYDEYGGIDEIDPTTDDWIKRGFIKKSQILGSSTKNQIDFFLWHSPVDGNGKEKYAQEQFEEWFINKKPCIKGSDSHSHTYPIGKLMDGSSNPTERYCWIKADSTFEGLKQVVYDPESRVFIGEKAPVSPTNVIDKIILNVPNTATINIRQKDGSYKKEAFCFTGVKEELYLSPFFNCFIGGRGAGKSTILNFLGQQAKDPDSSKKFWEKIQPSFNQLNPDIFSFNGVEIFEFIGQSEVEAFATDKEAFTAAIYERANILNGGLLINDEIKLKSLIKQLDNFQSLIKEMDDLSKQNLDKEKEKKTLESSIKITKSQEYSKIVETITEKSNQKQELETWRTTIDELRDSIEDLKMLDTIEEDEESENQKKLQTSSKKPSESVSKKYQDAYKAAQTNIATASEVLEIKNFKDLAKQEDTLFQEIEKSEKELSELLKKAGLSEENILQVKRAPQKLVRVNDELSKLENRMSKAQKEIDRYQSILDETEKMKKEYEKLITDSIKPLVAILEEQAKENKKKDIKNIGLIYFFDEQQAWKEIASDFYDCFYTSHTAGERSDYVKSYIAEKKDVFSKTQKEIEECLAKEEKTDGYIKFLRDVFAIKTSYQIFQAIRDSHLNNVSSHKRIQVLYDGKDIERASFGQKCTAVMVLLLLFGNYPLIIDEPEAHLDSSLVANYLVPLIKMKKSNRQIIFATHNANFVVNGDAEKIFILKNETGKTEIIETTIENLPYRDELLKLEGGKEAFRKRGEKLNI